jgi:hypothetical protein
MTETYSFFLEFLCFWGGLFYLTRYVKLDCVGPFEYLLVSRFWQQGLHFYFSRSVYYCELCESNCSGEKQLDQHLR